MPHQGGEKNLAQCPEITGVAAIENLTFLAIQNLDSFGLSILALPARSVGFPTELDGGRARPGCSRAR